MQHQHQINGLQSAHSANMAKMLQSKADSTTRYNAAVAEMNANQRQIMQQHVADHNASVSAMRSAKQGAKVSRNERVNVQKLANQQRLNNVAQRLDAHRSQLTQEQHEEARVYSQRMKMLSFSHIGKAKHTQNRNAAELEERRQSNRDKVLAQQNKAMATNERYRQHLVEEELRHGKEMCDMKAANEAKSSNHAATVRRMQHKNKHRNEDLNHMSLQFVAMEDKLKQSNTRCAVHERALAENAQTVQRSQKRQSLLIAQDEVLQAVKATIEKQCADSANQAALAKHTKFESEQEEMLFTQNEIERVANANDACREGMTMLMESVQRLNMQMRGCQADYIKSEGHLFKSLF